MYLGKHRLIERLDVRPVRDSYERVVDYVFKTILQSRTTRESCSCRERGRNSCRLDRLVRCDRSIERVQFLLGKTQSVLSHRSLAVNDRKSASSAVPIPNRPPEPLTSEPIRAHPLIHIASVGASNIRSIVMSKMNHHRPGFRNPRKAYETSTGPTSRRSSGMLLDSKRRLSCVLKLKKQCEDLLSKVVLQNNDVSRVST
jgi:hypothetical protein